MARSFKKTDANIKAFKEEIKKKHNGRFGDVQHGAICICEVLYYNIKDKNDSAKSHYYILAFYCSQCEEFIEGRGVPVMNKEGCIINCPHCKSKVTECSATNKSELSQIGWCCPHEKAD